MSECYTIGGDTWQPLQGFDISAQTFSPVEGHILTFVDVDLWLQCPSPPWVYLRECDALHNPVGPVLSDASLIEPAYPLIPSKLRARYQFNPPVPVLKGHIYSIHMRKAIDHAGPDNSWLYDKDDATYPRGHIVFSDDGGNTWAHFPNSDFMFCEFGYPPSPASPPVPPISYFACLDLQYEHHPTSITFVLSSSVPCHLDCFYTEIQPVKHLTERIVRGARTLAGTYHCFVAWKLVEQTEPGDTLYHTFEIPDWSYCQVKWFTFRGTVAEITSPSIGPIFMHHHPGVPLFCNLGFEDYPVEKQCPPCWTPKAIGTGTSYWWRNTTIVREGNHSMMMGASDYPQKTRATQIRYAHPYRGKILKFTVWWFTAQQTNASITIKQTGPGSWWYAVTTNWPLGWRKIETTHYINPNAETLSIMIQTAGWPGRPRIIYWDDLSIEEV